MKNYSIGEMVEVNCDGKGGWIKGIVIVTFIDCIHVIMYGQKYVFGYESIRKINNYSLKNAVTRYNWTEFCKELADKYLLD